MKIYITKYALTGGVQVRDTIDGDPGPNGLAVYRDGRASWNQYAHKGEWFDNPEAAVADAELRRAKKIASLRKQITKLEAMTFAVNDG